MKDMLRFELNSAGVRELLKSAGAQAECLSHAQAIAARDAGKHSINTRVGKNRCNAEIVLTGKHAEERSSNLV